MLLGHADWIDVTSYGESHMAIILFTDCESRYDHLKKEGAVPDDNWVAVAVLSLSVKYQLVLDVIPISQNVDG